MGWVVKVVALVRFGVEGVGVRFASYSNSVFIKD